MPTSSKSESARLPEGGTAPSEFLLSASGEYEFARQMGMFRGKIIVK